jgi:hypothetical protein
VDCLAPSTAADRAQWIRVATALKRLGENHYEDWLRFSRAAPEKFGGEHDCRKTWESLHPHAATGGNAFGQLPIGVGTLRYLARRDSPEAYAALVTRFPPTARVSGTDAAAGFTAGFNPGFTPEMRRDLVGQLRARFPAQLGELPVDTHFQALEGTGAGGKQSISFSYQGLKARLDNIYGVFMGDAFVGSLLPDVPVKGPLSSLHKSIDPEANFVYNRDAENTANLKSVTPNIDLMVSLFNMTADDNRAAKISGCRLREVTVDCQKKISSCMDNINAQMQRHGESVLGSAVNQMFVSFINNGTINVYNDPDGGRRSDTQLASVLFEHSPWFQLRVKFVPDAKTSNCNGLYVCDAATNVWRQRSNSHMEERLVEMIGSIPADMLNCKEHRHVTSRRGTADILYVMARRCIDDAFVEKLDSRLNVFALEDCAVEARAGSRSAISPQDFIRTTAAWSYDAESAAAHKEDVLRFFERLLPVPEERRTVLAFFASSLSGSRSSKKILALTDKRQGNNGKSSLLGLMRTFFGDYYSCNTKFVCAGSFQGDRNSHDAGLEPFKGKRLVAAEELKNNMTLDVALLKMLSGGEDVVVEGRKFGSGDRFKFTWQANIVLVFNEGDCPKFDSGDSAFMERLLVAPMRSKFVASMPEEPDEHTFLVKPELSNAFPQWRSALLDLLLLHFDPSAFREPPEGMRRWGQGVAADANPLADWMQQRVLVTGDKEDYLLLGDMAAHYNTDDALKRVMPAAEFKRLAKAYLELVAVSMRAKENIKVGGVWITKYNVARGIKLL